MAAERLGSDRIRAPGIPGPGGELPVINGIDATTRPQLNFWNENRGYEHNNYTEAYGVLFQSNHFGPLRAGRSGNNLKDRSSGTIVRYNWIESGNRQLDLVDSDYEELYGDPLYRRTFIYGNILIEPAAEDFTPAAGSDCIAAGAALDPAVAELHTPVLEHVRHALSCPRPDDGHLDIGAYEYDAASWVGPGAPCRLHWSPPAELAPVVYFAASCLAGRPIGRAFVLLPRD